MQNRDYFRVAILCLLAVTISLAYAEQTVQPAKTTQPTGNENTQRYDLRELARTLASWEYDKNPKTRDLTPSSHEIFNGLHEKQFRFLCEQIGAQAGPSGRIATYRWAVDVTAPPAGHRAIAAKIEEIRRPHCWIISLDSSLVSVPAEKGSAFISGLGKALTPPESLSATSAENIGKLDNTLNRQAYQAVIQSTGAKRYDLNSCRVYPTPHSLENASGIIIDKATMLRQQNARLFNDKKKSPWQRFCFFMRAKLLADGESMTVTLFPGNHLRARKGRKRPPASKVFLASAPHSTTPVTLAVSSGDTILTPLFVDPKWISTDLAFKNNHSVYLQTRVSLRRDPYRARCKGHKIRPLTPKQAASFDAARKIQPAGTGPWSKEVNGLSARLIVQDGHTQGADGKSIPRKRTAVELKNHTDTPIVIPWRHIIRRTGIASKGNAATLYAVETRVVDGHGLSAEGETRWGGGRFPNELSLTVPAGKTITRTLYAGGADRPVRRATILTTMYGRGTILPHDGREFFLHAKLRVLPKEVERIQKVVSAEAAKAFDGVWVGELILPPVKVPLSQRTN